MLTDEQKRANKKALDAKWRAVNREKKRAQDAAYKAANADRLKAQNLAYSKRHRDKIRAYRSQHHATKKVDPVYKAKMLEVAATWRANNPDKVAQQHADRAAKLSKATPLWADLDAIALVYQKRDEYSKLFGQNFQVDHIVPINSNRVCGLHVHANLQLLEKSLNSTKGNKFISDW